jgi:hypothetical protein
LFIPGVWLDIDIISSASLKILLTLPILAIDNLLSSKCVYLENNLSFISGSI